ncbi:MAG: hypothetical protein JWP91_1390 [Fibrobacteres bacterium]|nr:hypothetical protein [Fibrobacterota bacterium]
MLRRGYFDGMRAGALCLIALGAVLCGTCRAEDGRSPFLPDFARLQFAGHAGLLSVGPGYSWWDNRIEAGLAFGFVPEFAGTRNTVILSQKNSISTGRLRLGPSYFLEPLMAGFATHLSIGKEYEIVLPESQRDYYWPDALYFWMFGAAKAGCMFEKPTYLSGVAAMVEVGTINQDVQAHTRNHYVTLGDILSVAISAQFYL